MMARSAVEVNFGTDKGEHRVGNKNDYLTLEESARVLGKPVSSLKTCISEGKVSAKLAGGRWLISVRNLDKLKRSLPPQVEKTVHSFLAGIPAKEQQRVPRTKPKTKTNDTSQKRSQASNVPRTKSEFEKRIKDLNKQIREIREQIGVKREEHRRAKRSGNSASDTSLNKLYRRSWKLEKQQRDIQAAWRKNAPSEKQQKKEAKKSSNSRAPQSGNKSSHVLSYKRIKELEEQAHRLLRQIKALDNQISNRITLVAASSTEAMPERKFYDDEVLKNLVLQQLGLMRRYAQTPDPLGRLPALPPRVLANLKRASQSKREASKDASGQASPTAKAPLPPGLPTNRLSWNVLPAGEWSVAGIRQHYNRLQRRYPHIEYDRERIDKALSLNPDQCFIGKNEFEGYIVFTFAHTPKTLLECPVFGNAIYIIHSDWKRLSRKTKQELKRSPEVTRIIHRANWFQRVKRELGSR